MQPRTMKQRLALIALTASAIIVPTAVHAAMTPACTTVSNRARVTYNVGTVLQSPIDSLDGNHSNANQATTFIVGVKVKFNLTRSDNAEITGVPGDTNKDLSFTLTNLSNATIGYALTMTAMANTTPNPFSVGLTDKFDAASPADPTTGSAALQVDTGSGFGAYGTPVILDQGAPAANIRIRGSFPSGTVNNDLAVYKLVAQAQTVTGTDITNETAKRGDVLGNGSYNTTCNALGATTVEVVLDDPAATQPADAGDIARDGKHTVRDAYKIVTAALTITKSSKVYWDPVNGLGNGTTILPKAIPGAVVTYTIAIDNTTGASDASAIKVIDDLNPMIVTTTNITWGNLSGINVNNSFDNSNDTGGVNCSSSGAGYGILVNGACTTDSSADGDHACFNSGSGDCASNKMAVDSLTVTAGTSKTIKYQVTINQ